MSPKWKPQVIAMSGVTDPYQLAERKFQVTRRCLEVLREFRNPVIIVTKNFLVTRDQDLLADLAHFGAAAVFISITTLDGELARTLEPRTAHPSRRLQAVRELFAAGVPVGVMVAPVIPGLTDHEIPAIVAAAAKAGARFGGFIPLRLPFGVKDIFVEWLERAYPARAKKVLSQVRSIRGGRLNDPAFGSRMRGEGVFAKQIQSLFELAARKAGWSEGPELSTASFRRPQDQPELFAHV